MLPSLLLNDTETLLIQNTQIPHLCEFFDYLTEIKVLNVKNNKISAICQTFANEFAQKHDELEQIWLGGNNFHCDREMTWMADWLNTFTTPSGYHIVRDYRNLTCESGSIKGKLIHKLNEVNMGCYPSKWTRRSG